MTVASGATLGGIGTVGSITADGATVSPGDSAAGVLIDTGSLNLGQDASSNNSAYSVVIDGSTAGTGTDHYSQTQVAGAINLTGATLNVTLGPDFTPSVPTSFTIIDNTGSLAVAGTFNGLAQGSTIERLRDDFSDQLRRRLSRQLGRPDRGLSEHDEPGRRATDFRFRAICRTHGDRERAGRRSDPYRHGRVLQRHNLAGDRNARERHRHPEYHRRCRLRPTRSRRNTRGTANTAPARRPATTVTVSAASTTRVSQRVARLARLGTSR